MLEAKKGFRRLKARKQLGWLYKQMLEAQGIRVHLRTTAGAMISETSE
jgi:hypothetical protein